MSIVARGLGLPASSLVAGGLGIAEAITTLYGDGWIDQAASDLSGSGTTGAIAREVAPDGFPGGIPSTRLLADAKSRQGFIILGEGAIEQHAPDLSGEGAYRTAKVTGYGVIEQTSGEAFGDGRIKRAVLVAMAGDIEVGGGCCESTNAEFVDVELEAFALAAAVGVNEWLRAA